MVSIQERFVIKSRLLWGAYGRFFHYSFVILVLTERLFKNKEKLIKTKSNLLFRMRKLKLDNPTASNDVTLSRLFSLKIFQRVYKKLELTPCFLITRFTVHDILTNFTYLLTLKGMTFSTW